MGARTLIGWCIALAACGGPRPEVDPQSVSVSPAEPGYQRVELVLRNTGGGHGEVAVDITLRGTAGHVVKARRTIELAAHEQLDFVTELAAPADTYTAEVAASYPD